LARRLDRGTVARGTAAQYVPEQDDPPEGFAWDLDKAMINRENTESVFAMLRWCFWMAREWTTIAPDQSTVKCGEKLQGWSRDSS
jgi:hypothetical protein